jgi:hypothetical protein
MNKNYCVYKIQNKVNVLMYFGKTSADPTRRQQIPRMENLLMSKKEIMDKLGEAPNEKWKKFFDQFSEIETLEVSQWKPVHLIGYFCKLYKNTFNSAYTFKFNSPTPSKSFEVFQIKKLGMQMSSKPEILKEYIDWFYEGIVKNKKRFTSISAMTKEELVNHYKWNILTSEKQALSLDRSTMLSSSYQEILTNSGFLIKTYGDLAFMYHVSKTSQDDISIKFNDVLDHMKLDGFDVSVLERIT